MSELLVVGSPEKHITTVTLNRADKRNALNLEMYRALKEEMAKIAHDRETRVVILQGEGRFFSAGADMREFLSKRRAGEITAHDYWREVTSAHMSLARIPQPVIAKIRGGAMGAGCALAIWCDFRMAEAGAEFGVPAPRRMGIELGLLDTGRFVINFGAARARELLAFGANFNAEEALQKGLLTWVVPNDQLDQMAMDKARQLATNAPLANATWKLNIEMVSTALKLDPRLEEIPWDNSQDAWDAITAFLERREPPEFVGN